ncbi:ribonuclease J [Limisalsivibrio acetivorans]|uniref:ribonuclease J n=1 Tax=Limisalsivibrio acetivorans TaxID=1304888 RepID=UPI0003B2EDB7|nr:ribonuclease J [Limisalsivibrio acetivorans]
MSSYLTVLGGVGEIGMNMYVYESMDTAVIVDCGVMFADYSTPGVDYIIPDFSYLERIKDKLKGIFISHGHEDHIGGISFLLAEYNLPVYGGALSLGILEAKLSRRKLGYELRRVEKRETVEIGDISVTFLPVTHSIGDTYALAVQTPDFSALHVSDFKIDYTPAYGEPFRNEDFAPLAGLDLLLMDATNAHVPGSTDSESSLRSELSDIMQNAEGRVFFTTFSSNLDRIRQIMEIAKETGRKVVVEGASLERNVNIATKLGYMEIPSDTIIPLSHARKMKDSKVCFIITGSQGEMNSTLYRVASRERKDLHVKEGDLFIISARVIPGNEKSLNRLINNIYENGGEVVDIGSRHIHVSGHAAQDELKTMLKLTKPRYLLPVHGEEMHLASQRKLARESVDMKNRGIIRGKNGSRIGFDRRGFAGVDEVEHGTVYIDLRGRMVIDDETLKDRKSLCRDGAVSVSVIYNRAKGGMEMPPVVRVTGFAMPDHRMFELRKFLNHNIQSLLEETGDDFPLLEEYIKKLVRRHFRKTMDRRPAVAAAVMEV